MSNVEKSKLNIEANLENLKYQYPDLRLIKNESFRSAIENIPNSGTLNIPLGQDNNSNWIYYDITKMPNLLIGGTVMSGKTNLINSILLSLISKYSNEEIKIVLADSKGVDYLNYNEEPHLLAPVIKDSRKLASILKLEVDQMKYRYYRLAELGLKNIATYNNLYDTKKQPYHLIVIDDYTSFAKSNINELNSQIEELAKNGWNTGFHIILVANHPTADILTSLSKANFPCRISFRVPSIKDSRMILEVPGAEKISGIGNALINSNQTAGVQEIHTSIIDDNDIYETIKDLNSKNKMEYVYENTSTIDRIKDGIEDFDEQLYNEIVDFCVESGKVSASLLQRRFRLGYNRAARCIDLLEDRGIIGPSDGSNPREVLLKKIN